MFNKVAPSSLKLHSFTHIIPDMKAREWKDFCHDIATRGIMVPLEVFSDGTVVDGKQRLRAALELGLKEVPVIVVSSSSDSVEDYMLKATILRRHLSDDQRATLAVLWKEENKKQGQQTELITKVVKSASSKEHHTLTQAARFFNVSRRKIDQAALLFQIAPEKFEKVRQGDMKLSVAYREVKEVEHRQRIASLFPPIGSYHVLVVDPPWSYNLRSRDITHRAANPYPSMTIDELTRFILPAAPDSILWLWTTNSFLHEAFHLITAWKFEYKTMLTWVKNKIGLGDWLRGKTEHCLLAIRGNYRITPGNISTVLFAPVGSHSEKPDEFYNLVTKLCPGLKIDIFARKPREGWDVWGDEVNVL